MNNPMAKALMAYPEGGWVGVNTHNYSAPEQVSSSPFADAGGSDAMGQLGAFLKKKYSQPTGKDIGASAAHYGPEVAKMGGQVMAPSSSGGLAGFLRNFGV